MTTPPPIAERADLLELLQTSRHFLRFTVQGLTDEQARERTPVSELTLGGLIEHVAGTDELVRALDLDVSFPLPEAPWFPPGAQRSVRRTFLHIAAETAQHAGHADILRESLDGQKTTG